MSLKIDWETLRSSEFTVVGILHFSGLLGAMIPLQKPKREQEGQWVNKT